MADQQEARDHSYRQHPQGRRLPPGRGVARGWRIIDFWIFGALLLFLVVVIMGLSLRLEWSNLALITEWRNVGPEIDKVQKQIGSDEMLLDLEMNSKEPDEELIETARSRLNANRGKLEELTDILNSMRGWALIIAWVIFSGLFGATMRLRHSTRVKVSFVTQWQERVLWSLSGFIWGWLDFPFYLILLVWQRQNALPDAFLSLRHILFIVLPLPVWLIHDLVANILSRPAASQDSGGEPSTEESAQGGARRGLIMPAWRKEELQQIDDSQLRHFLVSHQNAVKFVFLSVVSLICKAVSLAAPDTLAAPLSVAYFWLFLLFCAIVGFDLESSKVLVVVLLLAILILGLYALNLLPQVTAFVTSLTARGSPAIYATIAGAALFLTLLDYFRAEVYPYWVEGDIIGHVIRFTGASRTGTLFRAGVEAEHPDFIEFIMYQQGRLHIRGVNLEEAGEDRKITIDNVPDISFHSQHISNLLKKVLGGG